MINETVAYDSQFSFTVTLVDTSLFQTTRYRFFGIIKHSMAEWLEHSVYNRGVASSSLTIGNKTFIALDLIQHPVDCADTK